jgi:hypothetical protein
MPTNREAYVWCANCFAHGRREFATVDWPGMPICRSHFIACGGVEETPEGAALSKMQLREENNGRN